MINNKVKLKQLRGSFFKYFLFIRLEFFENKGLNCTYNIGMSVVGQNINNHSCIYSRNRNFCDFYDSRITGSEEFLQLGYEVPSEVVWLS